MEQEQYSSDVYVRGDVTLQMLARSRRQPIIKWEESDVIQIHAHLARHRLARHECDKIHLDELAKRLGLLRDFQFNTLVHPPLRAKIKREFDRLAKEKHVTGDDCEWGPHTQRWAEPGWAGDRNERGRDNNGAEEVGDEGVEPVRKPSSELGPDDSVSVRLADDGIDSGVDQDPASLPPRADGLGENGGSGSIMSACNRVLRRDISSLGQVTEDHFNALHLNRGRLDVRPYHLERAPENRSVSSIDLSRLVLSAVYNDNDNNNDSNSNNKETTRINSPTNGMRNRIPLGSGALLSPPQESSFQNMQHFSTQPQSQVSAANCDWSHIRHHALSHTPPLSPPLLRGRRDSQPLDPYSQNLLHRPAIFSRQLRGPRRVLLEQLLSRQKGLLTDMVALAVGIRFTKYQIASHERFHRFRPYKAESLRKTLFVARHRLGSSLAKVMAIEDTLVSVEPALRTPAGMNGLLHVIFALSCEVAARK